MEAAAGLSGVSDATVRAVVEDLTDRVLSEMSNDIFAVVLYGSAVRGTYRPGESDIDLLIVGSSDHLFSRLVDLQTDVGLKYCVAISILFNTPRSLREELDAGSSFMKSVIREGIVVYGNTDFWDRSGLRDAC
jgi:predicted nucleotidyltransferase